MLGVRQSGIQAFRFARLPDDLELLERARRWAHEILDADPLLQAPEHALLEDAIVRAYGGEALEPIPA
jgi:ATP-dependent DNA helicase RecG